MTDFIYYSTASFTVRVHEGRVVKEIKGEESVESVLLDDENILDVRGVFIESASGLGVMLDPETMQHITTNKKQEINIPGLYAGDICGPPWQIAKEVGEGCVAGLEAGSYMKKFK